MHEIITLHLGQQANYLGTHYWNTQESYFTYSGEEESPVDHDISFRPGIGADGTDTYTPRTLVYDLKGAFGTLRRENALCELQEQENPTQQGPWSGSTARLQLPSITPSPYQQALDRGTEPPQLTIQTVRFWSDYNHVFHHPRSIVQLNDYELNSSLMPFEKWQTGQELFSNLDREHDLLDRDLRPFLEECDQLQGLQIFTGVDDAWGGFTAQYLERISDELGKGCRWVFGLKNEARTTRERQMLQMANFAQSLHSIDVSASLHIPISSIVPVRPAYLNYDPSSPWHTSALQSAIVESITLPSRLRSSQTSRASFDALETTLNHDGNRRIAAAGFSAEDPAILREQMEIDAQHDARMTNGITSGQTDDEDQTPDIDLFPNMTTSGREGGRRLGRRTHVFSRTETLRGAWKSDLEIQESNASARDRFADGPRTTTHQSQLLFPMLPSYPHIFNFPGRPQGLAIKASLSASTRVADGLKNLQGAVRRLIGVEEREALSDGLMTMAEEYEEGWSGSDEDDDD